MFVDPDRVNAEARPEGGGDDLFFQADFSPTDFAYFAGDPAAGTNDTVEFAQGGFHFFGPEGEGGGLPEFRGGHCLAGEPHAQPMIADIINDIEEGG